MDVLERAIEYLRTEVRPAAQAIDQDPSALLTALNGLCERSLMGLRRPHEFGGPALNEDDFRTFQEECARASGTLSFLQTQHQSAVSLLAKSDNDALKLEYLPRMADGQRLLGIGFSQLRRTGPPIMRAEQVVGGYHLDGSVPWVTGCDFFHEFVVGATLADGRALFAIVPFVSQEGLGFSETMRLAAMEAANTVSARFDRFFVPVARVLFIQSTEWIRKNDEINIALQGHFALGCARAGIDILEDAADKRGAEFIRRSAELLANELAECKRAMRQARTPGDLATDARLDARAWSIELAVRCAHAAVAASSGGANALSHPAQRVFREALVYTVSAQTSEIMEATLARLTRKQGP